MERQIKYLLDRIKSISDKYDEIDLISGSRFNLFNVLNITSDEVRLHSKFISELLNPEGSHGQGSVFLKMLVEEVGVTEFDCEAAKVEIEKYIEKKQKKQEGELISISVILLEIP